MDWGKAAKRVAAAAVLAALPALAGCGAFFQCEGKSNCSTSSSSTGNIIYAGNSSTGTTYLNAYTNTSGTLAAVSGSPFLLSYVPTAMAVTPSNGYLYVSSGTGSIYSYVLSTAGVPSTGTSQAVNSISEVSMDISADGKCLVAVDNSGLTTIGLRSYTIGASGVLTAASAISLSTTTGYTILPQMLRISPDNGYVAVAMGSAGTAVYTLNTSGCSLSSTFTQIPTTSARDSDNAIAWDGSDNLYLARSVTSTSTSYLVQVYNASSKALSSTTYPTGANPTSLAFSKNYTYLYVGNRNDSTISAFKQASGALTSVSTTNFSAPTTVAALVADRSGNYIIAAGYDSASGLQAFSVGTTGGLTVQPTVGATGTSTTIPSVLATTH